MGPSLIFATSNRHKVVEVRQIAGPGLTILTPAESGLSILDFPETSETFEGNARQKAEALFEICQRNCFAEDTGLEVDALDGAPGIYTARYAGLHRSAEDNITKLLAALEGADNRAAQFRTVIVLFWEGQVMVFEGIVRGTIAMQRVGDGGFGYDPVFIPEGYTKTFAELPETVKNKLSHRGRAVSEMLRFLNASIHK
jgi:XTP/dITP diphosphohydrolase